MKLSVIIVNYNVKYFLEQCLLSVIHACDGIESEIIVIDNASVDGSTDLLKRRFPNVRLTVNADNVGFGKANNQGIRMSSGEYVLLLNPDTIVAEDTLSRCIAFMDAHPDAGALGVRMIDGTGRFLPESKRGLPTPAVSFFKVFGISKLFPKSRLFNRYHLGYLGKDETHAVDVLSGACMMIRRKVLDTIGLLDEDFFMYGEDIDLSYRITQAGYKNYYYPETSIIHYKGESTRKGSLNFVRMFYQAMILFTEKHFSKGQARVYRWAIRAAVYLKALLAGVTRVVRTIWLPLLEAGLIFAGLWLIKDLYARNVKDAATYYPEEFMYYIVPIYVFIWIGTIFFSGGYDKPYRFSKALRGVFIGTIIIAAVYGFLPDQLRYSRAIILLGAAWAGFLAIALRVLSLTLRIGSSRAAPYRPRRLVIVGNPSHGQRVLNLLNQTSAGHNFIGFVSPPDSVVMRDADALANRAGEGSGETGIHGGGTENGFIGSFSDLPGLAAVYDLDEVVFCTDDVPAASIIRQMVQTQDKLAYKVAASDSSGIIGSNSKKTAGDLYAADLNLAIAHPGNRRNKRLFDVVVCLGLLVLLPIILVLVRNPAGLLRNWGWVLAGRKSWVGYAAGSETSDTLMLPPVRKGVLNPASPWRNNLLDSATLDRLNLLYARDYSVRDDWRIVWRAVRDLGRS
jgi:GT2 family glycosyltransferase